MFVLILHYLILASGPPAVTSDKALLPNDATGNYQATTVGVRLRYGTLTDEPVMCYSCEAPKSFIR